MLDELLEAGTQPTISAVNFTEVCYRLAHHAGVTQAARQIDFLRGFLNIEELDASGACAGSCASVLWLGVTPGRVRASVPWGAS